MEQMRYFGGCGVVGWMKKFIVWNEWKEMIVDDERD